MLNTDPYLDYWQKQNQQQKVQNQYLAEQARESLTPIIKYLTDTFKIKKIILFGSLAKGKFKETSDIDLAVAGIPVTAYFQALAKVNSLSDR